MKRRFFIQGGSAAIAAAVTGCGGGGTDVAALDSLEEAARKKPRNVVTPTDPIPTDPIPTDPIPAPPANTIYTFQQEFTDPSAPLLRSNGGAFYPYFTYFGGDAQPDGPNGYRGWNDELQVYTTSNYTPAPFNPHSVSNSVLTITAKPNPAGNLPKPYLSGCLDTSKGAWWDPASTRNARGGFEQKYGYWEARCRMPKGKGLWAAFWLTGGIQAGIGGEKMGEIDIFETIGDNQIHQTVHNHWGGAPASEGYAWNAPFDYAADFHTYAVLWTPDSIIWYVDGVETRRASAAMCARYAQLRGPLSLCFNLALGGGWAGSPDSSTPFPAKMDIDYVRVKAV